MASCSIPTDDDLTAEQRKAVRIFKRRRLLVVQGGPGSGKSTAIRHMMIRGERMLLCAPTGSAAQRLTNVTDEVAYTIRRVLESTDLIAQFRGANIIADESGMINIEDATLLIRKLQPKRIAFIGDEHQIPCIKGHSVLSTLLRVPSKSIVHFSTNHRQQESALVRTLENMGKGKRPEVDPNFVVTPCRTTDDAMKQAVACFRREQGFVDAVGGDDEGGEGVLFLALTNAKCDELNKASKPVPDGYTDYRQVTPSGVCVGDRIVCCANVYHEKTKLLLVANGTTGIVSTFTMVKYDNGFKDRKSRKPSARRPTGFRSTFVTARAMTVQKAQGNEFTYVGIVVIGGGWSKVDIEIMFTALSRFKRKVYLFGQAKDLDDYFLRGEFRPKVDVKKVQEIIALKNRKRSAAMMMAGS